MKVNDQSNTSTNLPELAGVPAAEVRDLCNNELSDWLDKELAKLEANHCDFVTHASLRRYQQNGWSSGRTR